MSAPIWRFTLAAGVLGRMTVQGAVMPSVDRVGRLFPLTVLRAVPGIATAGALHLAADDDFATLEDAMLETLDADGSRDALAERLRQMPDLSPPPATAMRRGDDRTLAVAGAAPERALTARALGAGYLRPCIFATAGGADARLLASEGLPPPAMHAALFDVGAAFWPVARA
jgi:type VI secretion system protein ImpM